MDGVFPSYSGHNVVYIDYSAVSDDEHVLRFRLITHLEGCLRIIVRMTILSKSNEIVKDFPGGSDGEESACNAQNSGSILGLGRSPGEGNGYPLQYSCLKNSVDKGVCQAPVCGLANS